MIFSDETNQEIAQMQQMFLQHSLSRPFKGSQLDAFSQ